MDIVTAFYIAIPTFFLLHYIPRMWDRRQRPVEKGTPFPVREAVNEMDASNIILVQARKEGKR